MPWLALWGTCWRGKQSSGLDPDREPQSPYFPAARSTSFGLLVWLGMNGTGLVYFQTGFTSPHYKLHHALSFPLPYLSSPSRAKLECKGVLLLGAVLSWEDRQKWPFILLGVSNSFRLRGGDVLRMCERKHWKGKKGTKREEKKSTARKLETNFKLWIISHPGSN